MLNRKIRGLASVIALTAAAVAAHALNGDPTEDRYIILTEPLVYVPMPIVGEVWGFIPPMQFTGDNTFDGTPLPGTPMTGYGEPMPFFFPTIEPMAPSQYVFTSSDNDGEVRQALVDIR